MKQTCDREAILKNPDRLETEAKLAANPHDAELYYEYGMCLFRAGNLREAKDAFYNGLVFKPFNAWLHFGRGRCLAKANKYWEAMADFELACRLDSNNCAFRYYMATTENLAGHYEKAVNDFRICVDMAEPEELYPWATWLHLTYLLDLNDSDNAQKALSLVDDDVQPRQMDYGYHRCVQLFKGIIEPENFVDLADIETKCLKQPGRIQLELNMMYSGLYAYSIMIGDDALGREAITKLTQLEDSSSFGYKKGMEVAKRMGLV